MELLQRFKLLDAIIACCQALRRSLEATLRTRVKNAGLRTKASGAGANPLQNNKRMQTSYRNVPVQTCARKKLKPTCLAPSRGDLGLGLALHTRLDAKCPWIPRIILHAHTFTMGH